VSKSEKNKKVLASNIFKDIIIYLCIHGYINDSLFCSMLLYVI